MTRLDVGIASRSRPSRDAGSQQSAGVGAALDAGRVVLGCVGLGWVVLGRVVLGRGLVVVGREVVDAGRVLEVAVVGGGVAVGVPGRALVGEAVGTTGELAGRCEVVTVLGAGVATLWLTGEPAGGPTAPVPAHDVANATPRAATTQEFQRLPILVRRATRAAG